MTIKKLSSPLLICLSVVIAIPQPLYAQDMSNQKSRTTGLLIAQGATVAVGAAIGVGVGVALYKEYFQKKDTKNSISGSQKTKSNILATISGVIGGAIGALVGSLYALALNNQSPITTNRQEQNDTPDNTDIPPAEPTHQEPFVCKAPDCQQQSEAITLSCGHKICFDCAHQRAQRNINKCVENAPCKGKISPDMYTILNPSSSNQNNPINQDNNQPQPNSNTADSQGVACTICMEDNASNPVSLACNHSFCLNCIKHWLNGKDVFGQENTTCPNCRNLIGLSERIKLKNRSY